MESQSASYGEKYILNDSTGIISKFVRNGGADSPVIESTMEFKDGPLYQDALNKIEKIVTEVKNGNSCTKGVPELQEGIDFAENHKTIFGKRAQTFSMTTGCSHHSELLKITTEENFIEAYSAWPSHTTTLKVSFSGDMKDAISQEDWPVAGGTRSQSVIKFTDKQRAQDALERMKAITVALLNGNVCTYGKTNLVEAVSKLDELIRRL